MQVSRSRRPLATRQAVIVVAGCLFAMTPFAANAQLNVGADVSIGGGKGVDADVTASVGSRSGVKADADVSVGGRSGINSSTSASIGGRSGVNASTDLSVGGNTGGNVGVSVGRSGGSGSSGGGGGSDGNSPGISGNSGNNGSRGVRALVAQMSDDDIRRYKITCRGVLSEGTSDPSLRELCQLIRRIR